MAGKTKQNAYNYQSKVFQLNQVLPQIIQINPQAPHTTYMIEARQKSIKN